MTDPIPIYINRDSYIPTFEVRIAGKQLPSEVIRDVIEVSYSDNLKADQFDTFDITINNWDAEKLDFKYSGSKDGSWNSELDELFDPGQEIELWMGYRPSSTGRYAVNSPQDELTLMMTGIITNLAPSFPSGGQPTLKISGPNALIKMISKQETFTYKEGLRDSEIAEKVGKRGSLTLGDMTIPVEISRGALAQEDQHEDKVLQANQYDILFLLDLARHNGYELFLKQKEDTDPVQQFLYFGPSSQTTSEKYLLEWGKSLTQFDPTLTTAQQVNSVTVRSWNVATKKQIEATATRKDLDTRPLKDLERLYRLEQGFQGRHEVIVDKPLNKKEAKKEAKAQLERLSKGMVTARGATVGTPSLRAGRKIEIKGFGRTFDGQYVLESSTHSIGSGGYTTSFEAHLEEDGNG
jgi:phage protein D